MNGRVRSASRSDWLAAGATLAAVAACYGTTLVVATLSLLGVAVAINEALWAGAISFLAVLAWSGVLLGYRRYRMPGPAMLATAGAASVLWAMYGRYHWLIELAGLAALGLAAFWDWRLRRSGR
ncbi:MerC mercury resistance protein [Roseovarius azorensis]|uniref:MerC mercury resistance protein n=1 Tax=Roseovarius azorensis TaxID=1287727 RepID=A0A1H7X2Z5_9RHOB|nr:MerC family mercury resistance protein [Roseovarius azorensis]SEM28103.1 MerC mercury resistance protein [Roseovarius azorensis]